MSSGWLLLLLASLLSAEHIDEFTYDCQVALNRTDMQQDRELIDLAKQSAENFIYIMDDDVHQLHTIRGNISCAILHEYSLDEMTYRYIGCGHFQAARFTISCIARRQQQQHQNNNNTISLI